MRKRVNGGRLDMAGGTRMLADIAAIDVALDHLNDKHADPKVALEGAEKVLAEVALLDHEIDKLDRKAESAGSGGLIGKILGGASGGLDSMLSKDVPLIGTSVQTLGLLSPVIGGILVELTGVVSGFAAAGAGAGAFALLAMPAVKQVQTAYSNLNAAQAAYSAAQAKYKEDPTKSNATALKNAAVNLDLARDAIKKMPADAQGAIKGIQGLVTEFHNMSKAFAPDAFKVFNDGLKIAHTLLPDILPFAKTFATVLDGLLKKVGGFVKSKGFEDWLKQFHNLEGPALNSIGTGIGKVAIAIGKLLTIMSGKDVAHAINILFDGVAGAISGLTSGIHTFMQNWDSMSKTASRDAHEVASSFDSIRHGASEAFDAVRHAAASMAHDVAHNFDAVRHAAATWVSDMASAIGKVVSFFAALPGKIIAALGNLGSLLFNAGVAVVEGFIHGIESMFGAVAAAGERMVASLGSKVLHLLGISSPSMVAHWWGEMTARGFAGGLDAYAYLPADAAARMAAGVSAGLGGAAGRGGGGQLQLQVSPGGGSAFEQFMVLALRNYVRVRGGNVQSVIGH